ncbi:hypothetical protein [Sphingomonas canadensis]|nr:hypothetical protein [Sphingomonas canadensis]
MLSPEYNLRRAQEEREKAARARTAKTREAHLKLAEIFEQRAVEGIDPRDIH